MLEKTRGMESPGGLPRGGDATWVCWKSRNLSSGDNTGWGEGGIRAFAGPSVCTPLAQDGGLAVGSPRVWDS